jgi:hypothetical protein
MKNICICFLFSLACFTGSAQTDTTKVGFADTGKSPIEDTALRIINMNPVFSLHVDSTLSYQFQINKFASNYFWFMRNAPLGLKINKDNGLLYFKADKSYFLSGRLKYDYNYKVTLGVQNLTNSKEKTDSVFTIVFYNTDIIASKLKPTVSGTVWIDEGDTLSFKVLCETGNFPIESILTQTSTPIGDFKAVQFCNDEFRWAPSYDFVKETDTGKIRSVIISFIGTTKFKMVDTAQLKIIVKNGLNYPLALEQYRQFARDMNSYILRLKFTFLQLDKSIKKTKGTRTGFDLTAASAALSGTVLSTSKDEQTKRTGLILPSVGVILSPVKEATAPTKTAEQNQATLLRSSIKRLEYVLQDNALVGEKDIYLAQKSAKLKEELKQSQMQLIDVPIDITNNMTEEELNHYFNSRKVMKKYSLKK